MFNLIQEMRTQRHSAVQTKVLLSSLQNSNIRVWFAVCKTISKSVCVSFMLILVFVTYTQEQYELVHRAIAQLFEKQLQKYESCANWEITDGLVCHFIFFKTDQSCTISLVLNFLGFVRLHFSFAVKRKYKQVCSHLDFITQQDQLIWRNLQSKECRDLVIKYYLNAVTIVRLP